MEVDEYKKVEISVFLITNERIQKQEINIPVYTLDRF